MQPISYSLHQVSNVDYFSFSRSDYSRFKFGDEAVSKSFGSSLADGFIADHLSKLPINKQIVVVSSPYSFIPTATFSMKNYFVFRLNRWLSENGFLPVQETKVHRTITYKEDYGELDAAERLNLIGNDEFHIDKGFLENKTIIFLDDIKITGSHERMILKMVKEYDLTNDLYMLYFAELINKNIHPNIENYLNYYKVKSILDLDDIIKSGSFCINTRIVKYILISEFDTLCIFLQNQTEDFINQLYDMALGNSYHTIDSYSVNLSYIKSNLSINNYKLI